MTDSFTPIQLPQISPDEARAEQALSSRFTPFALSVGKARLLAELGGMIPPAAADLWLVFTLDGADAAVQVPDTLMARCLGQAVEQGEPSDIALLLEDALADWLDAAEAMELPTMRFRTIARMRPGLPISRSLILRGQTEDGQFLQYRLPLALGTASARRLGARLADQVEPRKPPPGLMVAGQIFLTGPEIRASDLARLVPGDGLKVPMAPDPIAPFTLKIGTLAAAVLPDSGGYRLTSGLRAVQEGDPFVTPILDTDTDTNAAGDAPEQTDEAPVSETESTGPNVSDLPLQISFRIGEAALSIGEIETMASGALIPVPGGPDATLEILANGRKIGLGELVAIGETRAVRVLALD